MFRYLESKLKKTLFVFFAMFVLSISLVAFLLTSHSIYENTTQLALSYAEQQKQHFLLQTQLTEETASLFLHRNLLNEQLLLKDTSGKITSMANDYLQSSLYLSSIQIYVKNGSEYFSRGTNAPLSYAEIEELFASQPSENRPISLWCARNVSVDTAPIGYSTYISEIYSASEGLLGYLVFNTDFRQIFDLLSSHKSGIFEVSASAIQTASGSWISQSKPDLFQNAKFSDEKTFCISDSRLIFRTYVPKSEDYLFLAIPVNLSKVYVLPAAICTLSAVLLILIGYYAILALSDSIILPLRDLYHKMSKYRGNQ